MIKPFTRPTTAHYKNLPIHVHIFAVTLHNSLQRKGVFRHLNVKIKQRQVEEKKI
jgi:hypothetical protein